MAGGFRNQIDMNDIYADEEETPEEEEDDGLVEDDYN